MKNKLTLFTAAAMLLASCGTVSITRRYHRGGFQIEFNRNGDDAAGAAGRTATKKHQAAPMQQEEQSADIEYANVPADAPVYIGEPESTTIQPTAEPKQIQKVVSATGSRKNGLTWLNGMTKKQVKQHIKSNAAKNNTQDVPDGTLMWIIYLILCFIIPPLAYYLITRETDTLFWICLLFFLLAGSYLIGIKIGWILGVISVVIALLALLGS